ncbi:serine/threonine-protein kinase PknD [Candidatus Mycobacterium wuenschmannii]|uniref:non-specific serine/threonine protein kinase n=1 Tax=Candidatus Mycobacterium wuenschmannii TaxID=3027808 RepID=A0ABY8VXG1_9MYCO|nr:serine/threonine-protein kinase PknD [Candidatus Mycobacterium wuenschmannii]WIM87621.1 serine/threonine-protein kinase PknD [Candidatus Mycobacterium wuenschmannii]
MQGSTFGNYRLLELLGRGGMGEVWRAHDTVIDRIVAIKILPPDISQDDVFQQRFRREAHAAARLNSAHVVPIHTHGEIGGRLFVDMRLVEGDNLQSLLDAGPLPPERAVRFIEQIAMALQSAHKAGLLHRDVKPSNILIDDDDYAYLIDFGIARAAGERALTTAGDVMGTFYYMAPERFMAQDETGPGIDARSDIYSLTCVLYECLTSKRAFPGDSLEQQVTSHLSAPPPRPSLTRAGVSPAFDAVIARGMAKNPVERYGSAVELARAAREALSTPGSGPGPVSVPRPAPQRAAPPPTGPESFTQAAPNSQRKLLLGPPWWQRKPVIIAAAALLVVAVIVGVVGGSGGHDESTTNLRQTVLPFTGLREPQGLSVDIGGTVYVADTMHNRILALSAGSTDPVVLPFEGLSSPTGVTADNTGTVYVNDAGNKRVLVLPSDTRKQAALPFADLDRPTGLTVDSSRTVYVTDTTRNHVVALAAGSNKQYEVPFTGLNAPTGLVVGPSGTIYVADSGNNRVLSLPPGSTTETTLPFVGLSDPGGVTVDSQGAVYVTDSKSNRALKLPAGSSQQDVLSFTDLDYPWGLAVDNIGTVYVAGHNNKILALRPE